MTNSSLSKKLFGLTTYLFLCAAAVSWGEDWKTNTISPVTNPIFFENPQIQSEIRPIFMYHNVDKSFLTQGGDLQVYAAQLRWAATDRLAVIATKDGYIDFNPTAALPHDEGFADLALGLKFATIDNKEEQFILTHGIKIELPTGNKGVFQGNGSGEEDLFVSTSKGWGKFHAIASAGFRVPNDTDVETAQFHTSLHLDYFLHRFLIPFISVNSFTMLNDANQLPLNTEGYDLINFGSSNVRGRTQAAVGGGFRSRLFPNIDLGFAYEAGITDPKGLFDDRFTVDLIYRF